MVILEDFQVQAFSPSSTGFGVRQKNELQSWENDKVDIFLLFFINRRPCSAPGTRRRRRTRTRRRRRASGAPSSWPSAASSAPNEREHFSRGPKHTVQKKMIAIVELFDKYLPTRCHSRHVSCHVLFGDFLVYFLARKNCIHLHGLFCKNDFNLIPVPENISCHVYQC